MAAPKKKAAVKKAAARQQPDPSPQDQTEQPEAGTGTRLARQDQQSASNADLIRQDRSLQLVQGMFVVGGDPTRRETYQHQIGGVSLIYRFSPMNAFALRVLHALAAMLQLSFRGEITSFEVGDSQPAALAAWAQMGKGAPAFGEYLTTIRTSNRQLAEAVGENTSGPALKRVYEALKQLSEVMIHMKNLETDTEVSTPLIQVARRGGEIVIIVNPRMVKNVAQRTVGGFSLLSAKDVKNMRGESTVLVYTRLCAYIDEGKSHNVGQDRLETYIWGDVIPISPETRAPRKARARVIRGALAELEEYGWTVVELRAQRGQPPTYKITRPKFEEERRQRLEREATPTQLTFLPEG